MESIFERRGDQYEISPTCYLGPHPVQPGCSDLIKDRSAKSVKFQEWPLEMKSRPVETFGDGEGTTGLRKKSPCSLGGVSAAKQATEKRNLPRKNDHRG